MKKILLVVTALAFILPNASPVMADRHGKDQRKHYREQDREDRKFYKEQEKERREFHKEQEREEKKHRKEREKDERKHRKEKRRDARRHDQKRGQHHNNGRPPQNWRKRVEKGKQLDDDIYVHLQPVPSDIKVALPPLPPGISYKQIENEIIKIDDVNRKILDVLEKSGLPLPPIPPVPGLRK